jgi:transcriptional regulator with XRE-family HTH domain
MTLLEHSRTVPTFTIGDRLRKARLLTGLEQSEFARLAGIARGTVANYEHERSTPKRLYLRAWADAAGVDLTWLETGEPSDDDDATEHEGSNDRIA